MKLFELDKTHEKNIEEINLINPIIDEVMHRKLMETKKLIDKYIDKWDTYKKNNNDYKICLADANYNIEKADNINEDRAFVLQTDDTMVDFYNIDNDIDKMELSNKRKEMVKECIENRKKK